VYNHEKLVLAGLTGCAILSVMAPARADSMSATVRSYDGNKMIMTFATGEIIDLSKYAAIVPPTLSADDIIEMDFSSSEDGFTGIHSIVITADR
jgi:hypothetical protein